MGIQGVTPILNVSDLEACVLWSEKVGCGFSWN